MKPRKQQEDRLLKQLNWAEKRYQRRLRTLIIKDLDLILQG